MAEPINPGAVAVDEQAFIPVFIDRVFYDRLFGPDIDIEHPLLNEIADRVEATVGRIPVLGPLIVRRFEEFLDEIRNVEYENMYLAVNRGLVLDPPDLILPRVRVLPDALRPTESNIQAISNGCQYIEAAIQKVSVYANMIQ